MKTIKLNKQNSEFSQIDAFIDRLKELEQDYTRLEVKFALDGLSDDKMLMIHLNNMLLTDKFDFELACYELGYIVSFNEVA